MTWLQAGLIVGGEVLAYALVIALIVWMSKKW